ncbi:MAG TPA: hypothetical protein VHB77_20070, partial [Planctomycetaceae bacterium]|nr:hypothetical protein [Planctomycetaceae bacterium]
AVKSGKLLYSALERLARAGITAPDALLLFRTPQHTDFEMPAVWAADQKLAISNMDIHFFRKSGDSPETDSTESSDEPTV